MRHTDSKAIAKEPAVMDWKLSRPFAAANSTLGHMGRGLAAAVDLPGLVAKAKSLDAMQAARYAWIGGLALIAVNIAVVFSPMFVSRASTQPAALQAPATRQFVTEMQQLGFEATIMENIAARRSGLSPVGTTVALSGDSVQAFEYGDAWSASREAKSFAEEFAAAHSDQPLALYQERNLLVLYLGNRENVLKALETTLGAPVSGASEQLESR